MLLSAAKPSSSLAGAAAAYLGGLGATGLAGTNIIPLPRPPIQLPDASGTLNWTAVAAAMTSQNCKETRFFDQRRSDSRQIGGVR